MHHTRQLCAIVVIGWTAVLAAGQAPPGALPPAVRTLVQNGNFAIVTSLRGLPLGIRDALPTLFGTTSLDIAEPDAAFERTGNASASGLPTRRMVAAGCTRNDCLIYYERGGSAPTWHVALYHWTPDETRFEWGGSAPGGLKSIDDVRKAILAGAVTGDGRF